MTNTPGRIGVEVGDCNVWVGQERPGSPKIGDILYSVEIRGIRDDRRDLAIANARRLAALWNMADELGLSTEDIEDGCVQKLVADAFTADKKLDAMRANVGLPAMGLPSTLVPFTKPA
jgi:hypothetical protein